MIRINLKISRIQEYKCGPLKIIAIRRHYPIKEFQQLADAIDEFKKAIADSMVIPVLNWLDKILRKA